MTCAATAGREFESDKGQKDRLCCGRLLRPGGADVATICSREKKGAITTPFGRIPSLCLRSSRGIGLQAPANAGEFPLGLERLSF